MTSFELENLVRTGKLKRVLATPAEKDLDHLVFLIGRTSPPPDPDLKLPPCRLEHCQTSR